jgi:hypothetical protein
MKKIDKHDAKRILTRRIAKQLDAAALKAAAGGTVTYVTGGKPGDYSPF